MRASGRGGRAPLPAPRHPGAPTAPLLRGPRAAFPRGEAARHAPPTRRPAPHPDPPEPPLPALSMRPPGGPPTPGDAAGERACLAALSSSRALGAPPPSAEPPRRAGGTDGKTGKGARSPPPRDRAKNLKDSGRAPADGRVTSSHHSKDLLRLVLDLLFQGVRGWGGVKDSARQCEGWRQKGAHVHAGGSQHTIFMEMLPQGNRN